MELNTQKRDGVDTELVDIEDWLSGTFTQFLISNPTSITRSSCFASAEYVMSRFAAWHRKDRLRIELESALSELSIMEQCSGGGNWRRVLIQRQDFLKSKLADLENNNEGQP